MGKALRKLVQPVLAVPIMTDIYSESYDSEIIVFVKT